MLYQDLTLQLISLYALVTCLQNNTVESQGEVTRQSTLGDKRLTEAI